MVEGLVTSRGYVLNRVSATLHDCDVKWLQLQTPSNRSIRYRYKNRLLNNHMDALEIGQAIYMQ